MTPRSPFMLAAAFLALASGYVIWFNVVVRTDIDAATSRFEFLLDSRAWGRAAPYGERILQMRRKAGAEEEDLAEIKSRLARAHIGARHYARGAELSEQALSSAWGGQLSAFQRADLEDALARAHIFAGNIEKAAGIYANFLDSAGDEGAGGATFEAGSIEAHYASKVSAAADLFAESLKPIVASKKRAAASDAVGGARFAGSSESRLVASNHLATLGAFYAMQEEGIYAAAGVLAAAYDLRRDLLAMADEREAVVALQRAVQVVLVLGPVYVEMGRLEDAERLYLEAFHAQEKNKGSNSPELSLYIKLLAGVYEKQGRATEAQALYEHMRALFRDAFGAQRYAANREHDRRLDFNRPVSQFSPLPASYAPTDLVPAAAFSVPLSKSAEIDEMKLRRAPDPDADPEEANLPARLAQLISLCRSESGERVSLRSGYRSYTTQQELFSRIGHKGTVTPPGMSEHQTGLAVDIDVGGRLMRRSDATYQCFEENAFLFGFILSYPPGNNYLPGDDSFEPWHWRYVGVKTAQLYREAGPHNQPQEFLAEIDCYEEKAAAGIFPTAGETDVCLQGAAAPAAVAIAPVNAGGLIQPETAQKLNNETPGARAP